LAPELQHPLAFIFPQLVVGHREGAPVPRLHAREPGITHPPIAQQRDILLPEAEARHEVAGPASKIDRFHGWTPCTARKTINRNQMDTVGYATAIHRAISRPRRVAVLRPGRAGAAWHLRCPTVAVECTVARAPARVPWKVANAAQRRIGNTANI